MISAAGEDLLSPDDRLSIQTLSGIPHVGTARAETMPDAGMRPPGHLKPAIDRASPSGVSRLQKLRQTIERSSRPVPPSPACVEK